MSFQTGCRWRWAVARGLGLLLAGSMAMAAPVEGPLETVTFQAGDTIRGVAERYPQGPRSLAADPRAQRHRLAGRAEAGAALKVPVQQVAAADAALAFSLASIQKATAEGARIFAPDEIGAPSRAATPRSSAAATAPGPRSSPTAAGADRVRRPGARDLDRAARPGGGGGSLGRPGQRRGPRAGAAALVAAGSQGRAGRVRAGAHAVGVDRAGDLPRPEPAAAEPQLERDDPADAQRPADRRRGHQGQPGRTATSTRS